MRYTTSEGLSIYRGKTPFYLLCLALVLPVDGWPIHRCRELLVKEARRSDVLNRLQESYVHFRTHFDDLESESLFYRRLSDYTLRCARKWFRNIHDAEDASHESVIVITKILKEDPAYFDINKLGPVIKTIVGHVSIDLFRKNNPRSTKGIEFLIIDLKMNDNVQADSRDEPPQMAIQRETKAIIKGVVNSKLLTENERSAISGVYFDGKTIAQSALDLGVTERTLYSRLRTAKKKLKAELSRSLDLSP